jgi:hypothetical protein
VTVAAIGWFTSWTSEAVSLCFGVEK